MGPKAKPKKKQKNKDMAFMTDEEIQAEEEAKKRAEQERLERERLLREMENELRKAKIKKRALEKIEIENENFRDSVLENNCSIFKAFREEQFNLLLEKRKNEDWETYRNCNHRPLPNDPPALNTYLYCWKSPEKILNINNILQEVEIMYETIIPTEKYIGLPLDLSENTLQNIIEARLNYFSDILDHIDKVTLDAVMDTKQFYRRIDLNQIEILRTSENFILWLWGWALGGRCEKPKSKQRPKRTSPFMSVTMPGILDTKRYHFRIVHTSYDPYSIRATTYHRPALSGSKDLLEETKVIRKIEVGAIRELYGGNYDEEVMPWWFLIDEDVVEEKRKREMKKKKKKKKADPGTPTDILVGVDKNRDNVIKPEEALSPTDEKKISEEFKEKIEDIKVPKTEIVYSRSMMNLLEARKKECRGPVYYPEVDMMDYLEESDTSMTVSDGSVKRDNLLFETEKHTTFRPCFKTEIVDIQGVADTFKAINESYYKSEDPEDKISLAGKRVFLDWKSFREISPDREAIREDIEEFLFGDTDSYLKDGKITYVKRNPQLRSIKELFRDIVPDKSLAAQKLSREDFKKFETTLFDQPLPVKAINVTEMKEMETEMTAVMDLAFQGYVTDYVKHLSLTTQHDVVNLRQYMIVGGVYQFDFFEEEPQPIKTQDGAITQIHYGDYKLKRIIFDQIPKVRIDLGIEAERKISEAQRKRSIRKSMLTSASIEVPIGPEFAQADDDLIWIGMNLPKNVIFFECPTLVRWSERNNDWTTENTYDVRWNEETQRIYFKLGKSGPFSIAVFRYYNLPYSDFHLKPSSDWKRDHSITFQLTTRTFVIDFLIKGDKITVTSIDHEKASIISHILSVPFTIFELVGALRQCGIDIFPDWDSFLYVNLKFKKLKLLEEHVYHCIGFASPAFEFKALYHNRGCREDKIFFQMRESVDKTPPDDKFSDLLVETRRTMLVTTDRKGKIKEDIGNVQIGYRPDLKNFIETVASKSALRRMAKADHQTIATVVELITATKLLSFS